MDKSTGKPFLIGGKEVTSSVTFIAESVSGTVAVDFEFNGSGITEYTELVVFESLRYGSCEIAAHADIKDRNQTVEIHIPKIGTMATADNGKDTHPNDKLCINDVVAYENLIPGKEYMLYGVLMNKVTGEPFLVDGKEVTSSVTFIAESVSGTVAVDFEFNGSGITEDTKLVVFEFLLYGSYEVAAHADIDDEGQTVTVYVPEIGTTATVDGEHDTHVNDDIVIVDIVEYENLIPGKEYTLRGVLMNKATGEPFLVDGKEVTAEQRFTPDSPNGSVEVTFVFDGVYIVDDTTLVAFESLYHNGSELAVHADIEDEDQTVNIHVPSIGTIASLSYEDERFKIEDIVKYENLVPGKTYVLYGTLMDKSTGEPFLVDGEKAVSTLEFVPDKTSGEITVTFIFDAHAITSETDLVVFETLTFDDYEIAAHTDLEDVNQTVNLIPIEDDDIPKIPQTGDRFNGFVWITMMGMSVLGMALLGTRKKKNNIK